MYCLGIESSCDETACAVVKDGKHILSNIIFTQSKHEVFGGVVPEIASREHLKRLLPTLQKALDEAGISLHNIDLFAATKGPGLQGALMIGLNCAKTLSLALSKPFIGVNHIEAHLYASLMTLPSLPLFPCMGLIISGGHTHLLIIKELGRYQVIGHTVDDALGEAFDKVAKMMQLGYPGGPLIEKLAEKGNPHAFSFKAGQPKDLPLHFSFSGLKTAVLYALKGPKAKKDSPILLPESSYADLAASFQHTAFCDLIQKTAGAMDEFKLQTLVVGGGVSQSQTLRHYFQKGLDKRVIWPEDSLSLDNAAMIAGLGSYQYLKQQKEDNLDLQVYNRLSI